MTATFLLALAALAVQNPAAPTSAPSAGTTAASPADPPVKAHIRLPLTGPAAPNFEDLLTLGLDLVEVDSDAVAVLATAADRARLEQRGIPFTIVREDEQRYYAERLATGALQPLGAPALGAGLVPPFTSGSIGGYYDFAEVVNVLDQLRATYPSLISQKVSIGQSLEGRPMWMVKISDNPDVDENEPEVRYDSLHHAREPQGMQTTLWYMLWLLENYGADPLATYLVNERELYFVPVVNPDGYVYNQQIAPGGGGLWRKNRRDNGDGTMGVDLNRNYPFKWGYDSLGSSGDTFDVTYRGPSPASEPETQNMVAFIQSRQFETALSTHTYSNLWLSPWGYDVLPTGNDAEFSELNELCTEVNGYLAGPAPLVLYPANGVTFDYDYSAKGTFGWTPEIGGQADGFWPPASRIVPLAEENLLAFQRVSLAAAAFVYVDASSVATIGDGDEFVEAGESIELTLDLRNAGRAVTGSSVIATLVIDSGSATVLQGASDFGVIGSFQGASNGGAPLAFSIDAGAEPGSTVAYRVVLSHEGLDQELFGSVVVGEPRLLVLDQLEVDLGWTAGLPGDTASTGIWELGDPNGTTSSGQPAQPEDDATPAGTLCFVTGNTGGSAGTDDVDNGFTRLLSPRLDLSGASSALLGYSRWYADLSVADDELLIEVSNDDGGSWSTLEVVAQTENAWTRVEFPLHDTIALTDAMRLRVTASDDPNNSLVEAAIDDLTLAVYGAGPRIALYGTAAIGTSPTLFTSVESASATTLFGSAGTGFLTVPGVSGPVLLDLGTAFTVGSGAATPGAPAQADLPIPNDTVLQGVSIYLQQLAAGAGGIALSNRLELRIE
ncbi:M14 family metallopeptidase [Engelhardtia mirabilis]|uniref:carboxypeptidase T n=1 Tax=Engelhardtia mirabilis TaxID=2528011 RepID=A0A518BFJ8_9BACT|nr:Carboxypeptidase T precursor [Planctomycetes bacterium Pla133]QDV00086.1 Carboxypeptidase T precursor [Planctomycetes bacterium Pla86]